MHELATDLVERFAKSRNPDSLDRTSKAILLMNPEDAALREAACGMMRRAHAMPHSSADFMTLGRALAEHRGGDPEKIEEFLDAIESDFNRVTTAALSLRAIARHRNGDPPGARRFLKEAEQQLATVMNDFDETVDNQGGWHDILACRILQREAARLIEGEKDGETQNPPDQP